jgi:indole-3-pyruvate monooxygenase
VNTVIIGASAAGLAAAACLKRENVPFVLLEQSDHVAASWRNHYDRLHLHTNRSLSNLPYFPMPPSYPKYPSRDQVVAYLESYTRHHQIEPQFGQKVVSVALQGDEWITETETARYSSRNVIVATGYTRQPNLPNLPGQEAFQGEILHSSTYKNGAKYAGKSVLVMGFGNSGGEIAIDLSEHGAQPALSVRSPVNVIPRDMFGIPVLALGILMSRLPAKLADLLSAPLVRLTVGNVGALGLRTLPYGPNQQIRRDHRIPLLNIGTIKLIREDKIRVFPGLDRLTPNGARFVDGSEASFDALVLATGYRPALGDFLKQAEQVTDSSGIPLQSGDETVLRGLYFCGFFVSPTGMLREIGIEAKRIASQIKRIT